MKAQSKVGSFIILGIFTMIILSFILTGFQSDIQFLSSGSGVATVDGNPIKIEDYQRALARQLKFYEQMFGGKALTQKQIEQFGVKRTVLKRLVDAKLIENLANDLSIGVSQKEIVKEIEKMPFFQKNGGFDISTYKRILSLNGFSTETFEANVSTDLKVRKIEQLLSKSNYVSKGFAKFFNTVQENKLTGYGVRFSKESLRAKLPISASEVSKFVKTKANESRLQTAYNSKKHIYKTPEQVRASHILIKAKDGDKGSETAALKKIKDIKKKLTVKNFPEMAKKHSEDSSASKGGDLNYFKKGQMVKPFEKVAFGQAKNKISEPVKSRFGYHIIWTRDKKKATNKTFKSVKNELAKELIRKEKGKELDEFFKKSVQDVKAALDAGSYSKVKSLKNKLGFTYVEKNSDLNLIEKRLGQINLSDKEINDVFKDTSKNNVFDFSTDREAKIVRTLKLAAKKKDADKLKKEIENTLKTQKEDYKSKFRNKLVKFLNDNASIVTYPKFL